MNQAVVARYAYRVHNPHLVIFQMVDGDDPFIVVYVDSEGS